MRKINPPFHVRPHQRAQRLCLKRHFALDDPQVPAIRDLCAETLGERGWSLREESSTPDAARMVLHVQKVFQTAEEAEEAGMAIVRALDRRTRQRGHGLAARWQVTAPDGQVFEVENLLHWCRANESSFLPHEPPGALVQSAARLADRVYQGLRDPRQRAWRGWSAVKLP